MTDQPSEPVPADARTEQLHVADRVATPPPVRAPGPLDLTEPGTAVLPINELMDVANEAPVAEGERPPPVAAPAPPAPAPAALTRTESAPPAGPGTWERVRTDAAAALRTGGSGAAEWLRAGDNGLIAATVVAAIVLLVVIGLV